MKNYPIGENMKKTVKLDYEVHSTLYAIRKLLDKIEAEYDVVSFDIETRSIYTKFQRELAKTYLDKHELDIEEVNEYTRILHSSGLSHPSIVKTTHIILGLSDTKSVILIVDEKLERYVFNWLVNTNLKILIHNASFDLKLVHHRTGRFPKDFEDTQQLAKVLINDCNNYKSRTGLKVLMGSYFPAKWSIKEETDYEIDNLKDNNFLEYCHMDGISVMQLWDMLKDMK